MLIIPRSLNDPVFNYPNVVSCINVLLTIKSFNFKINL